MSAFVVIEGPNGVGKSTVIKIAAGLLRDQGLAVHVTKEPSSTELGGAIRTLEPTLPAEALALACAADRLDHIAREIEPASTRGDLVLSDRYLPSSLVLQRLDGLELEFIWSINKSAPPADLTLYLEDDAETIDKRITERDGVRRFETPGNAGRELALYREARDFLSERGWQQEIIDQRGLSADEIGRCIAERIQALLKI